MGPTIKINNQEYEFEAGETILEVARRNEIYIPTLCNLQGTKPTGACRICIVELGKMSAPVASCSTPAAPGMDIQTDSPRIRKARKSILELLLISGNHNCAVIGHNKSEITDFMKDVSEYDGAGDICTAYGECELQSLAYKYMVNNRTLERIPTQYPLENEDPLIGRDFSRCILCGRCVQACTEVTVNNAITHGYRGNVAKIVARGDKPLPDSECVYCGECLQVCPVGALYEKRGKYDHRLWEVKKEKAVCYYCGVGCSIEVNLRDGKIVKTDGAGDEEPNRSQLCFKGRFGFDFLYHDERVLKPMIRSGKKLKEVSWEEALNHISMKMSEVTEKHGEKSVGCIVSPKYSNEDLFVLRKFMEKMTGSGNLSQTEPFSEMKIRYSDIGNYDRIVLIGTDICRENPVAANYVKRANLAGKQIMEIDCGITEISKYADERIPELSKFKPEEEGTYLVIHSPGYDVSALADKKNISLNSISRENNTLGSYMLGIGNGEYEQMKKRKMVICAAPLDPEDLDAEFVVVVDPLPGDLLKKADVVLPPAVWVENDGSYVNGSHIIYRSGGLIDPPGETKPLREIFGQLLKETSGTGMTTAAEQIWDDMINKEIKYGDIRTFEELKQNPVRVRDGFFNKVHLIGAPGGFVPFRAHHIYCAHCEGMSDIAEKRIKAGE